MDPAETILSFFDDRVHYRVSRRSAGPLHVLDEMRARSTGDWGARAEGDVAVAVSHVEEDGERATVYVDGSLHVRLIAPHGETREIDTVVTGPAQLVRMTDEWRVEDHLHDGHSVLRGLTVNPAAPVEASQITITPRLLEAYPGGARFFYIVANGRAEEVEATRVVFDTNPFWLPSLRRNRRPDGLWTIPSSAERVQVFAGSIPRLHPQPRVRWGVVIATSDGDKRFVFEARIPSLHTF